MNQLVITPFTSAISKLCHTYYVPFSSDLHPIVNTSLTPQLFFLLLTPTHPPPYQPILHPTKPRSTIPPYHIPSPYPSFWHAPKQ